MIRACPVNMECRLKQIVEFPTHELFIGEIVETHCDEELIKDGVVDLAGVQPILFGPGAYWNIGEPFAKTFSVGKGLKK
jgi:flavin reductase (DIM6/NTAB) family NADH-FMN oxidoreductase RutF